MRTYLLKASFKNGKLTILLRVEIDLDYVYKVELTELEREILELILQSKGVTQKELSEVFGKVKVCRIIQKLENKGLIEREKKGKTYIIRVV